MSAKRRLILAFAAIGLAVLLASGVAVADIINGTGGADTIDGTSSGDNIDGLDGNDTISGLGGADNIHGGAGNDYVFGGDADQTVEADDSNPSNDILNGDGGNDYVVGGYGDDNLDGGRGRDHITDPFLDKQDDNIQAGGGDDTVNVNNATPDNPQGVKDHVDCGGDHDRVLADPADEVDSNCEEVIRAEFPITAQADIDFSYFAPGLFRAPGSSFQFIIPPDRSITLVNVITDPLGEGFTEYFTTDQVNFIVTDANTGEVLSETIGVSTGSDLPLTLYTNEGALYSQPVELTIDSGGLFDVYTFGTLSYGEW